MSQQDRLLKGNVLQVLETNQGLKIDYRRDQGLQIDNSGRIVAIGSGESFKDFQGKVDDYGDSFLLPGFIDTHVHYPQIDLIGAYSGELIEWLENHTFPHEKQIIQDLDIARASARRFCQELYKNGTTTAVAFASSKKDPTEILFDQFAKTGGRLISGKISMNQHAPGELLDDVESDLAAHKELSSRWHGFENRLFYALSPRFIPSCDTEMLSALGEFYDENPQIYLQTHYAENLDELRWVKELYPKHRDYLEVYESFGMVGARTILAHGIHTSPDEKRRLAQKQVILSHCPTSNLFLGSGLFPWQDCQEAGVTTTLGTDVGAGTSFSMWQTLSEAIKISKLRQQQVTPMELFYSATLGAAKALGLSSSLGSLEPGKQADIQVLQAHPDHLLAHRLLHCDDEMQVLSALCFLANASTQAATWVNGKKVWSIA